MAQVFHLQQFREAAQRAAQAGVTRELAVQFVRHEQASGRTGQHTVNLLDRLGQRPVRHWSEVLA